MNRRMWTGAMLASLALPAMLLTGCGGTRPAAERNARGTSDHGHSHDGPHGGHVVELGSDAYHAEVVHDDQTGAVVIYVLDGSAKDSVAIDTTTITINIAHEGQAKQFELVAMPDAGDSEGSSSRFSSSDVELAADLDRGLEAQVVLSIAGKQYRGAIVHHHGHDHDHDHAHNHGHDH